MKALFNKYLEKLHQTPMEFIRDIHSKIEWNERLLAIMGGRGVGKSTMLLQHIRQDQNINQSLYVSADDLWFTQHSLYELAEKFYLEGGTNLYIDEIHKYKNWSQEIKNIYDNFLKLKVVYSGSSILDLQKGSHDLSRRLLTYKMSGLSFREFLVLKYGIQIPIHTLEEIINHEVKFPYDQYKPVALFKEYVQTGYYPYFTQAGYYERLNNVVNQILENDIPLVIGITTSTIEKIKRLMYIIVKSVPFKPNHAKIARDLNISRNDVSDLIVWLERSQLINVLREDAKGIGLLGKVDKVYLSNTNLSYAIGDEYPDIGNLRETVFLSLMQATHKVVSSRESDFRVGPYTFEVGGKNKKHYQVKGLENAFIVKDDIEYGLGNELPLWSFGLMY